MRHGQHLSRDQAAALIRLVLDEKRSIVEAREMLASGTAGIPPVEIGYANAAARVKRERERRARETDTTEDAAGIAARLISLLSEELRGIEQTEPPRDIERMERIGKTLGTLQRLAPSKRASRPQLLDLQEEPSNTES